MSKEHDSIMAQFKYQGALDAFNTFASRFNALTPAAQERLIAEVSFKVFRKSRAKRKT
ncbi:hypothetical protein GMST_43320 [Geomonas silvestris]|uniref:Uncharacterized protein n=1 Tax=Geomonas silvestris TaxID=2740184 RepID=A0A6V8MQ68_9BACT|nr:hypothetical protein [Geomonas silvestris]GFO62007.1 hypothetical protein GMST_43320 [Geomonas silvestris]